MKADKDNHRSLSIDLAYKLSSSKSFLKQCFVLEQWTKERKKDNNDANAIMIDWQPINYKLFQYYPLEFL
jgi:hypothetical protein